MKNDEQQLAGDGLEESEFGIMQGAQFKLTGNPTIVVTQKGKITITMSYELIDSNALSLGKKEPGAIPAHFDVFGAFNKSDSDTFDGFNEPKKISIDVVRIGRDKRVIVKSITDINIVTNAKAKKRESGSGIKKEV
jgi:hypothetical protein